MKHLIETTDPSGLTRVDYNRIILNSDTDDIIVRGGYSNGHPYVDLGLPSRTLWATMNVGAASETEVGDYFMWGSTTPNTDTPCDWEHAPFNGGYTEYNADAFDLVKDTVCPNGVLAKKYDAASQIMGGEWRMPTMDEFQELLENTIHPWVTDFNGTGVQGVKFTSKNYPSKYIFLPVSGTRSGSSFINKNLGGYFWCSSLDTSDPIYALNAELFSRSMSANYSLQERYFGNSVRGVL